jgi:hypothetical protein
MDRVRSQMAGRKAGHFFCSCQSLCADCAAAIEKQDGTTAAIFGKPSERAAHILNSNLFI